MRCHEFTIGRALLQGSPVLLYRLITTIEDECAATLPREITAAAEAARIRISEVLRQTGKTPLLNHPER